MTDEERLLQDARFIGTLVQTGASPSPVAPPGNAADGRSHAVNSLSTVLRPLCDEPAEHRGWEWWAPTGALVCGECHPPQDEHPRWLVMGGPLIVDELSRPDLTAVGVVVVLGRDWDPPEVEELQNDESAPAEPARRRGRHEALPGQLTAFSSPSRRPD